MELHQMFKKLLLNILLFTSISIAQYNYVEDFTGNVYDSTNWTLVNTLVDAGFAISSERLNGGFTSSSTNGVDYIYYQFHSAIISDTGSSFTVIGQLGMNAGTGNRSAMLGIWSSSTKYVGIAVNSVYHPNTVSLLIRNGGGVGTFTYELDTGLDETVKTTYKVTYDRATNEVNFFYWTTSWVQLGTTQVEDFGAAQFYPGLFFGLFNSSGSIVPYGDSVYVDYLPDLYQSLAITNPTTDSVYTTGDAINLTWTETISGDSIEVSISYDGGATYSVYDTVFTNNNFITVDSASGSLDTYIKIKDLEFDIDITSDGFSTLHTYDLTFPTGTGISFLQDSVVSITWTTTIPISEDTTLIYYTIDNGASWLLIDSTYAGERSYSWTVPAGTFTSDARIRITNTKDVLYTDMSANTFVILPKPDSYTDIEILSALPQPLVQDGSLTITVQSAFLDSLQLLWSADSLTWIDIATVSIDTVNSNILDTTVYVWTGASNMRGTFYLKALEVRSNQLYYDQDTLITVGSRVANNQICYNINYTITLSDCAGGTYDLSGSEGLHELLAIWDPSCGWNANVSWRLYRLNLMESLTTGLPYYSIRQTALTASQRQCLGGGIGAFPLLKYYEVRDTLLGTTVRYTAGEESLTSLTVNSRTYTLSKSGANYYIMVQDLLNTDVSQILVDYTAAVNTGGFGSTKLGTDQSKHKLGSYLKPLSAWESYSDSTYTDVSNNTIYVLNNATSNYDAALSSRLIDSLGHKFGDYNEGYIVVGDMEGYYNTYAASALPTPSYAIPVSEDVVTLLGVITRDYFRGIVPKAITTMTSGK